MRSRLGGLIAEQCESFSGFADIRIAAHRRFVTSVAVETPPRISVEHHIAELVGTHGTDAKLHGVGFACVFNHNEIGVDKNNRQNPGGQHGDFLLGDEQQYQEYEREYGQQCQTGNDHLWVPREEPVRAMSDDIAQFLAVGHRAEYGVQAHLFVHHAVVLGDHQVGTSQTMVEQRVQVHRIPAYDKSHEKRRRQIMEAVALRPETVRLDENGTVREIPAGSAAVGNIVQIRPGDRIPLDGVVVEGESRIDTSPITGEPVPVSVTIGSTLTSGCVNTSGLLKMRVEKELSESMVTRILDSVENAAASKPQAERFITKFARVYTPFVVALAAATAIIPSLITGNWSHWIYTALTFLVISCPCALVLSVPLAFFSGIGAGSRKGILFKGGIALETLKNVKTVVMDKTGTITKGNFIVQDIIPSANYTAVEVLQAAAACETVSTHPIGTSILLAAKEQDLSLENPAQLEEISGKGIHARLSCGDVLCGNRKLLTEFNVDCGAYDENGAVTTVYVAINGTFAGTIQISDTIKPEAKDAIRTLKSMGIRSAMLTGDGEAAAEAVADAVGIDHVYAKLLPADKLEILQKLRAESGSAMFVGDGINAAPVLAGADVGAAMGSGADAAIEAADVVFMTSSMDAIPTAIRIAKSTGAISNQNVVFALAVKALVMVLGLMGIASMWLAVFADTGVAILCVLNSIRILYKK